jgi:hypothetical protein
MRKFIAKIENKGMKFEPHVRNMFVDFLASHDGDDLEITHRKKRRSVTDNLRGYYFGAIVPFIKGLDENFEKMTPEQVHDVLKYEFNGFSLYNPISKKEIKIAQGAMNETCNTQDAFVYIEKIRRWVAENYGQELPDPIKYKELRDHHFETEPLQKVDYPTEEVDPTF